MAATDETKVEERHTNGAAPAAGEFAVENPATGETIGTVPKLSADDVAEMARRGRAAQPGWEAMGFEGRGRVLLRAQKWLLDNSDRVVRTIVSETGKAWEDAQLAEVGYGAGAFGYWAKQAPELLADERVRSSNPFVVGKKLVVRYKPVGLVGVIGPWNFPLTNSFGDCIPALAAGNAVILKPSEITPLTSLLMKEMLDECGCPPDVFQVATGYGETGAALVDEVDFIMFTGSTKTGRKVATRAAERLIPCGLELGGKDPMIVLADADIERAANAATYYSMMNAGQVCISVERVYVEEPIYDEFVSKVTEKVRALRQGESKGPGAIDIGAVIFPPQLDIVEDHVKDAVDKGAKVLVGGHGKRDGGRFYEPTVLTDVDHSMKAMTDETFGPTVPIMKVRDAEEAIKLANDSPYGLAASVWTKDAAKGEAIARQVEAGAVCVNDAMMNYFALEVPMGGWKTSGLGTRHARGGITKYCAQQTLLVTKLAMKKDINMFPYKARTTRLLGKVTKLIYGRGKRD